MDIPPIGHAGFLGVYEAVACDEVVKWDRKVKEIRVPQVRPSIISQVAH